MSEQIVEHNAELCKKELYEYGKKINSYIERGILTGYDMKSAIFEHILNDICDTLESKYTDVRIYKDNGKNWKNIKISDRHSPSKNAFDLLDDINNTVTKELHPKFPNIFTITFMPISLFELEVQDKNFQKERFTAVIVEIKCQILPTAIIVVKAE